ncbi:MAG TPA: ATPase domain-containing protein [Geminicoccaceae bacterium]
MARSTSGVRDGIVSTGIAGLDDVLGGGLPRGRTYLLQGQPGTGKTTLGLQFLLAGAALGEKVVYLTLSQTAAELRAIADSHGFELDRLEIVEMAELGEAIELAQVQTVLRTADVELEALSERVEALLNRLRPDRLVYDSLIEILLMSDSELRFRHEVLRLRDFLAHTSTTSLIVDTVRSGDEKAAIAALVHGVLRLEWSLPQFGIAHRRIAATKMRGHPFLEGFHDMTIETGGVEVYPRIVPRSVAARRDRRLVRSGIDALDDLAGGGVEQGTVCLIAGHSGVGKSTLATAFARTAALDRRTAAVFLFEEIPEIYLRRARELALDLEDETARPRIHVEAFNPAEIVPGKLYRKIEGLVDAGTEMIVIDSITGFFSALPSGGDVLVQFHALLGHLSRRNVLVVLVLNMHGLMDQFSRPDFDLSFISDTIILLRQFDAGSRIRRTVSVVKKRYGPHETEVREFRITRDGLEVLPIDQSIDLRQQISLGSIGH